MMKEIRWVRKTSDESVEKALQEALKVHPVLCKLLAQRGITNYDEARLFFRPTLQDLHNPFLMKDMERAVQRIEQAIAGNEKILIYGDYDVDGTTAVALTYCFLKRMYPHVGFYIPDRYAEGYGISIQGIDYAAENQFSLVIALDCGIKAIDKIAYASEKNIDFIICDHHLPGEQLPAACAVLNPKRSDCNYPYKELSGCGIGFKLIQALAQRHHIAFEEVCRYIDLVAVSIAADIVPITGENRVLAYYGLKKINENPSPGIRSLIELNNLKRELQIADLVFIIGPRINAAGRMKHANEAVELLIADSDKNDPIQKADNLNSTNVQRQNYDKNITEEALNMLRADPTLHDRKTTVLYQPHWHKGVIGIVASRLIDTYYRPTVILCESNGKVTGSARSVKGFNIYEAVKACADLLEQYGGHMYAAGLTMPPENVQAFMQRFEEVVSASITEEMLTPEIEIDAELHFSDINYKFYNILKQFAPFGPGNMRPVFMTRNVKDRGGSRVVGQSHLKLDLIHRDSNLSGIGFGLAHFSEHVISNGRPSMPFDICYVIEENEWNGNKSLQLNVRDIKIS
jgi:single-stranded-DNA-specific exonuclease